MILSNVLSDSQIEQIRLATEETIETTGLKVMSDQGIKLCRGAGAKVEDTSGIVRFPRELLRELIGQAPSRYTVTGVDGIERTLGSDRQWPLAIVTDPWIIDYDTQQPRRPRLDDVRRNTIVGQQLDCVAAMSCMDFPVTDVEGPGSNLRALEEHLLHHTKHNLICPASTEGMRRWLEIGRILARGQDLTGWLTVAVASMSPLAVTQPNVEAIEIACDHGFPIIPTVCPTAGMTTPFSLAGTLAQGNAEVIFLLALSQLVKPGHPFLYAFGPAVGDMHSGACLYYTLDKVLWKAAHVQLGKSYGLPVAAECGGSMTHRFDQQNGAEGMLFMLAAVGSGADLLPGFGSTYNATGHSSEMMVIHEAYFEAAQFLKRGMRTDAEHLAADAIAKVGPDGHYMIDDLTMKYMRGGEFFSNKLFDLSGQSESSPGLLERAHERVQSLVEGFKSPVPHDIQENLRRMLHDKRSAMEK